jgi:hypothetical protein
MTVPVVYDPRHLSWNEWASLMVEAYAGQQLSIPDSEDNWKEWASGFNGIGLFGNDGVPNPNNFATWQSWAEALVGIVANRIQ